MLTPKNDIYRSKELSPTSKSLIEVKKDHSSFPVMICIASGNDVSLALELFGWFKELQSQFLKVLFTITSFVLSSKRSFCS